MSPADGAALYFDHLEKLHQSPATMRNTRRFLAWFGEWLTGRGIDDLRDVVLQDLLDYHERLRNRRKPNGEPNCANYVNTQLWQIAAMFRLLLKRGRILTDPSRHLPQLRKPRRLPKNVLTGGQVNALLVQPNTTNLWGFRDRTMLELLYSSGLRGLEVTRITIHDIDWKERTVRIVQGKGRKDRLVPFGKVAHNYLLEYMEQVRPVILTRYAKTVPGRPVFTAALDLLFFSRFRTPVTTVYLRKLIVRYAKAAGLTSVSTHSMRHACATEMLKGGANVRHVQEMLGHSHLSTTQVYTHVLPYDLQRVHTRTAPSERRRVIEVPAFELAAWNDRKNSGHYR
jgi:integrase/recombinase XerD